MAERTRILFVEDELSISQPFAKALTREGFEAVTAATAAEALELADRIEPDLVLLDLNLPDGDGRDVCRELQRRHDVPVVMLTARGSELDRVVGLELGADDYVVKPFSSAEVIARIRAVLRRAQRDPERLRADDGRRPRGRARPRARSPWTAREVDLTRREYDLLERLMRDAGRVVSREDLLERRLGRQLVRLDQDAGRARGPAAPQARRRPGRALVPAHRPRRGLSHELAGGGRRRK